MCQTGTQSLSKLYWWSSYNISPTAANATASAVSVMMVSKVQLYTAEDKHADGLFRSEEIDLPLRKNIVRVIFVRPVVYNLPCLGFLLIYDVL